MQEGLYIQLCSLELIDLILKYKYKKMYEKSIRTYLKVKFSDFPLNYVDLELLAILALMKS